MVYLDQLNALVKMTNLKVKITDDFDGLESMLLTGIFSPSFFFSHFSVLLKILVRMLLRQQQLVEEM